MNPDKSKTSKRKKEHLELCLTDDVSFKRKSAGFENYEFKHYAITEVDITRIDFRSKFFGNKINLPFLISCMTGGTSEAENINAELAIVAEELKIPIGVGSQRQALEDKVFVDSFKTVRKNAPNVPVLGNIGAAQVVQFKSVDPVKKLVDGGLSNPIPVDIVKAQNVDRVIAVNLRGFSPINSSLPKENPIKNNDKKLNELTLNKKIEFFLKSPIKYFGYKPQKEEIEIPKFGS